MFLSFAPLTRGFFSVELVSFLSKCSKNSVKMGDALYFPPVKRIFPTYQF